ncbi:MAG: cupin domain-containing protein, partial [Pseudomonadales bacterium]|nr:cupin domain-containing protein [Pseudomonadales bacterium]
MKTAKDWLVSLGLEAHEEGGYFRRTYTSQTAVHEGVSKVMMSSIFYMLTRDSPIGFLHKNRSDIMHYFHAGSSLDYYLIDSDGELSQVRLGADLDKGEVLQLLVKGGSWKASRLPEGGEYGLISEAVVPGFDYSDRLLIDPENANRLIQRYPELREFVPPSPGL